MIPYGRQNINQSDIDAVVDVLQSDFLTQGPMVPLFEDALVEKVGAKFAVAVNSATSALHLACLALDLKPGDSLWTSPNSFVASANCARYCGADVDFVDINEHYLMCPLALEKKLTIAERKGCLPKIVVPVHFAGHSCDMVRISELGQRYGFRVIEDASHAVGAAYNGESVGSGKWSDATVFSFHPVKIITSGEGGVVCCNRKALADKIRLLRSHGITRDDEDLLAKESGPWYYEQHELGFNYRMTDIAAALGKSQLARIDEFIDKRRSLANLYQERLSNCSVVCPTEASTVRSSWHLYVVMLENGFTLAERKSVFEFMRAQGIGVNVHYIPIYQQPYYRALFGPEYQLSNMDKYYARCLSLPLHPGLSESDVHAVIRALACALKRCK